jgi:DNA-binding NarL/FixJ family response regulator
MREEPEQPPPPSARVRLEVAFLDDADVPSAAPAPAAPDERPRLTALIVAAEPDVRRYVGECLRARGDLRVHEAATARAASEFASHTPPDLAIVDQSDGLEGLSHLRVIVIVDEVPYGAAEATPQIRLLGRPFSAEELTAAVDQLLRPEEQ